MISKLKPSDMNKSADPAKKSAASHPIGTGIGAAAGAAAGVVGAAATGAAMGTTTGPIGAAAGAAIGAAVGGLVGKDLAEQFDSSDEESYWRDNYATRPYVRKGDHFEEYAPAYRYGWESYNRHVGRKFDDNEIDLQRGWDDVKGKSRLTWEQARQASRDAWNRIASRVDKN